MLFILVAQTGFSQVIDLRGLWKFHVGDDASWSSSSFRDSDWETVHVPSTWEDEGFNGYDGFAWYRVKFDGRKLEQDGIYYLNLGYIDDADEAYLNNHLVGFSGSCPPKFKTAYNSERKYVIPSPIINFNGENVLAIRVFDVGHRGGIVDGEPGIYSLADRARMLIDLSGIWSFAPSSRGERITDEDDWEKIMVPGPWEYQGHLKYDGFAWYKRTFTVPPNFTREPIVLLLGKIDDFDKVFVNGKQIGSTNDRRPYGSSYSFEVSRVYEIAQEFLARNGTNTIEVLVEDMGGTGGIYEGLIGITTKINYERYFR